VILVGSGPLIAAVVAEAAYMLHSYVGVREIATLDRRHFTAVRPRHVEAFTPAARDARVTPAVRK
jgi:hypothetical protein